jgi:hypothetical protein
VFDAEDHTIKCGHSDDISQGLTSDLFSSTDELIDRLSEEDLASFTLDKWMSIYKKAVEKRKIPFRRLDIMGVSVYNNRVKNL